MSWTKGWKAFDSIEGREDAGTCRGMLYEEGETYGIEGELEICKNGLHACKEQVLCYQYYPNATLFAEVELLGDVQYENPTKHKAATNKMRIVRFVREVPEGNLNSGNRNSGDYNSGHYNSGDCNSGHYNSGNRNSGHYNSGNRNSGDYNSGDCNSGNRNSGDCNSGNYNSGGWNSCNRETGFFNTKEPTTINVFNKPCDRKVWDSVEKPDFIYFELDDELGYKGSWQKAYATATEEEKVLLKALPNFDKDIFFELTGINIEE
jgi:hypothetical protein